MSLDEDSVFFAGVFGVMAAALLLVTGLAEVDLASISGFNLGSELLSLKVARFAWILGLAHLLPVYLFL